MASVGIRRRASRRTGLVTYLVWWLLDDRSQGAETVASKEQARALAAQKRLQITRDTWQGRRRGRLPFSTWADLWWTDWSADPHRSPHTLVMAESRLRNHLRPFFGERAIDRIGPADIRRWQTQLAAATVQQCRSLLLRIFPAGRGTRRDRQRIVREGAGGMTDRSAIEWTQATWNPVTGCDRISPGCQHCYALTLAKRLKAMGQAKYQTDGRPPTSGPGFGVAVHPQVLGEPLAWWMPRRIFVCSMADLFHARVPEAFIARVFAVMAATPQHTYQVLTKRPGRMARLLNGDAFPDQVYRRAATHGLTSLTWPLSNLWLGTSVEDQQRADQRIPLLLATPAAIRFLSCEPLLGRIDLELAICQQTAPAYGRGLSRTTVHLGDCCRNALCAAELHWIIAGGESGPGHRPVDPAWVRFLRDQATATEVAFFFKQWGGRTPGAGGRLLDGRTWDQYPQDGRSGEAGW